MQHDSNPSSDFDAGSKPRWRTPVLTLEKVVLVTNADTNTVGSDGQFTTHGVPLHFAS